MEKIKSIDAARGIAAILIIACHVSLQMPTGVKHLDGSSVFMGGMGVFLFCIFSAFTLFYSQNNRNSLDDQQSYRAFFKRRFLRIAPLYYLVLSYVLWIHPIVFPDLSIGRIDPSKGDIISHFLFINQFNPDWMNDLLKVEWSITVEMTFYALLPFLFTRIKNLKQALMYFSICTIIGIAITWVFKRTYLERNHPDVAWEYSWQWLPATMPYFLMGIVLYFIYKGYNNSSYQTKKAVILAKLAYPIFIIGVSVLYISGIYLGELSSIVYSGLLGLFCYGLLIYPIKLLVNPVTRYIGKISFGMYLWHYPIIVYAKKGWLMHNDIPIHITSGYHWGVILLTAIIATITYYTIERPFIHLSKKYLVSIINILDD